MNYAINTNKNDFISFNNQQNNTLLHNYSAIFILILLIPICTVNVNKRIDLSAHVCEKIGRWAYEGEVMAYIYILYNIERDGM